MSRKLRPAFAMIIGAIVMGKLVLPHIKPESSAQAFISAPEPCQPELDDVEAATIALGDAEYDLATAVALEQSANDALNECETCTPGQCQQEQQDVSDAAALVQAAQQEVDSAELVLQSAEYEYDECRYGCP